MATVQKKQKTPLIHIVKRPQVAWYHSIIVRAVAIVAALAFSGIVITLLIGENPLEVYSSIFDGAFGTSRRIWNLLQSMAMLLCISLAVTPAFKMRFWNIGAEGQVLIGGLATVIVMMFLGDKLPLPLLFLVMTAASILAGIVWAFSPL